MLLMSCVVSSDTLRLFRHVVRLIFVLFQPTVVQLAQLSSAEPVPVLLATVASLHVGSVASIAVLRPTCSSRFSTHGDALPLPLPPLLHGRSTYGSPGLRVSCRRPAGIRVDRSPRCCGRCTFRYRFHICSSPRPSSAPGSRRHFRRPSSTWQHS